MGTQRAQAGHRVALSVRQPWAALILAGLKTVEVRRWPLSRRGPILLHAAKTADSRGEGWELLPESLHELAALRGGIVGQVELVDCRVYGCPASFSKEQIQHLNPPDWFVPPRVYGLVFGAPRLLPFVPWPGNIRLFSVPLKDLRAAGRRTRMRQPRLFPC